jgi:starch phosphorylase
MMNGAITIGTLDGANIEILEEVGAENFFLFGLNAKEVEARRKDYNPRAIIEADTDIERTIRLLQSGHFNQFEPGIFDPIIESLLNPFDPWLVLADLRSYIDAQQRVAEAFQDLQRWIQMSILNTASSGRFSSDRTITDYNQDIWKLEKVAALPVN